MARWSLLLFGAVAVGFASSGAVAQTGQPAIVVRKSVYTPGDIPPNQVRATALRVDSLALEQPVIRLRVGDTLSLEGVVVVAYDSTGTRIGRLRVFDSYPPKGAVRSAGFHQYVAVAEGSGDAVFNYPRSSWTGRADPPAAVTLHIEVVP